MVSTAYLSEEGANKRFRVLGPEAIQMHEALRRYCAVFHPEIKKVTTMPFWLVRLMATLTLITGSRVQGNCCLISKRLASGLVT
ncbi:MAG: hypothetical protein EHM33_34470 [Chloroflexi bacterium]|nr:MAG: hypothetical protein EHM33_34470 [Chloroflexota bacterium]